MAQPPKRPKPRTARIRKRLLVAGLVAFLLVDAALVAYALAPREGGEAETPEPVNSSQSEATPTPENTASTSPEVVTVAPTRILAALDGSIAWRAITGPCGAPALPELTTDSGVTWRSTDVTGATGVTSLQRITVESEQFASMIGQDQNDCSAALVRTFVGGDDYEEYSAALNDEWYVNPTDMAIVHSPNGDFAAPCANVASLASLSGARAAVLCMDGALYATANGADTWNPVSEFAGAMTLGTSGDGYVVASVGVEACAGVSVGSFTDVNFSSVSMSPSACVPNQQAAGTLAGQIALAEGSGTVWLWAGDSLARSTDGGISWE